MSLRDRLTGKGASNTIQEVLLIMAGVLAALALQGWWEERAEQIILVEHLEALEREVAENNNSMNRFFEANDDMLKALESVFAVLADPDIRELPPTFERDIGSVFIVLAVPVTTSAYEDLVSSGNLRLIENAELMSQINLYVRRIDVAEVVSRYMGDTYLDVAVPILMKYTVMTNLDWPYDEYIAPGGTASEPIPTAPFSLDVDGIRSLEVWNGLYHWKTAVVDMSREGQRVQAVGEELVSMLQEEIERLRR